MRIYIITIFHIFCSNCQYTYREGKYLTHAFLILEIFRRKFYLCWSKGKTSKHLLLVTNDFWPWVFFSFWEGFVLFSFIFVKTEFCLFVYICLTVYACFVFYSYYWAFYGYMCVYSVYRIWSEESFIIVPLCWKPFYSILLCYMFIMLSKFFF